MRKEWGLRLRAARLLTPSSLLTARRSPRQTWSGWRRGGGGRAGGGERTPTAASALLRCAGRRTSRRTSLPSG
eukprot:186975-Hanusia_phi.AAC.2